MPILQGDSLPLSLLVISPRGGGKTTVAEALTHSLDRLVIIDTMHEPAYIQSGIHVTNPLELHEFIQTHNKFRVVYGPTDPEDVELVLQTVLVTCDLVLLVEEVSQYGGADAPGSTRRMFKRFVRLARHRRVKLVATTQRPADVDKLLVSESEILLGSMQEPNDRRYLRDLGSMDRETVDSLVDLAPFHFVHFPSKKIYKLVAGRMFSPGSA